MYGSANVSGVSAGAQPQLFTFQQNSMLDSGGPTMMLATASNCGPTQLQTQQPQQVQYFLQGPSQPQQASQQLQFTTTTAQPTASQLGLIPANMIGNPFGTIQQHQPTQMQPQQIQFQNFTNYHHQQPQTAAPPGTSLQFVNTSSAIPQTFILNPQQMHQQTTQLQLQPAQLQLQAQPQQLSLAPAAPQQQQIVQYMLPNGQIVQTTQPAPAQLQLQPAGTSQIIQHIAPAQAAQPQPAFFTAQPTQTFFQPAQQQQQQPTATAFIASPNGPQLFQTQQSQIVSLAPQPTHVISPQQLAQPLQQTSLGLPHSQQQQIVFQQTNQTNALQQQQQQVIQTNQQSLLIPACNQSPMMVLASPVPASATVTATLSPVLVKNSPQQISGQKRKSVSTASSCTSQLPSINQSTGLALKASFPEIPQQRKSQQEQTPVTPPDVRPTSTSPDSESQQAQETDASNDAGSPSVNHDQSTQCDTLGQFYQNNDDYKHAETDENHNHRSESDDSRDGSLKIVQDQDETATSFSGETEVQSPADDLKQESENSPCHFTDTEDEDEEEDISEPIKPEDSGEIKLVSKNGLTKAAFELINNKLATDDIEEPEEGETEDEPETCSEEPEQESEEQTSPTTISEPMDPESENTNETRDSLNFHTPSPSASSVTSQNQEPESTTTVKSLEKHIIKIKERFYNDIDLDPIREFAKRFKLYRQSLDLTQAEVCQDLAKSQRQSYSQSAICRFENLDVTAKSAAKIKPILELWIRMSREKYKSKLESIQETMATGAENDLSVTTKKTGGVKKPFVPLMFDPIGTPLDDATISSLNAQYEIGKKRKKRTSFTPMALDQLNTFFERNPRPNSEEMTDISRTLKYDKDVVRVWFCNKRQTLKAKKLSCGDDISDSSSPTPPKLFNEHPKILTPSSSPSMGMRPTAFFPTQTPFSVASFKSLPVPNYRALQGQNVTTSTLDMLNQGFVSKHFQSVAAANAMTLFKKH